jgi:hypothetical protein
VKRPSGGDIGTFGEGYSLAGGGIKVISVRRVATEVRVWHLSDLPTLPTNVGYQGKSGSDSDIVKPSLLTHLRHSCCRESGEKIVCRGFVMALLVARLVPQLAGYSHSLRRTALGVAPRRFRKTEDRWACELNPAACAIADKS